MLAVAALQLGDPVTFKVLSEPDDPTWHGPS
jgi:hypothetical protein